MNCLFPMQYTWAAKVPVTYRQGVDILEILEIPKNSNLHVSTCAYLRDRRAT